MTSFSSFSGEDQSPHLLLEKALGALKEMLPNQVYIFAQEDIEEARMAFANATQMSVQDGPNVNLAFGFHNGFELEHANSPKIVELLLLALTAVSGRISWETRTKVTTLELWLKPKSSEWLPISEGN